MLIVDVSAISEQPLLATVPIDKAEMAYEIKNNEF